MQIGFLGLGIMGSRMAANKPVTLPSAILPPPTTTHNRSFS